MKQAVCKVQAVEMREVEPSSKGLYKLNLGYKLNFIN